MRRMTIYLPEELHRAICAHADAAGQKLSTFISRELAYLAVEPVKEDAGASVIRQARQATAEGLRAVQTNTRR